MVKYVNCDTQWTLEQTETNEYLSEGGFGRDCCQTKQQKDARFPKDRFFRVLK
jgi:hypothetical protein